jgi:hypothetical protein
LCDALTGHDLLILTRKLPQKAAPAGRFLPGDIFDPY